MLAAWGVTCAAALVPQPLARTAAGLSRRAAPALMGADDSAFTLAILGDLHLDPRDLGTPAPGQPVRWHAWSARLTACMLRADDSYTGREHFRSIIADAPRPFTVSLGDLGESKDCTQTQQLFSGTTPCFELARDYLDGFGTPFNAVGGNHDLEGIDEFATDEENLEAYLRILGKETPQFCHEVAHKTLVVGISSTSFRTAKYTSHEVCVDAEQLAWFEETIASHRAEDGWKIFVFSHAPIIGSGLRVLQECHVVNGCCWLNHNDAVASKRYIQLVRENPSIKAWFSGHFHLSHDYEDSITFPGGNNRGSCVFAQVGCMTTRSTRDGRRHSRLLRGNAEGFEICTVNHAKGGEVRLDATITYSTDSTESVVMAHPHEDYDHDLWFSAYTPAGAESDGCYIDGPDGVLNGDGEWNEKTVCWWHMADGAVLGVHDGMIIEYDESTLAPLGMVCSKDELHGRKVAVIDSAVNPPCEGAECVPKEQALVIYSDDSDEITVVQPNEDGSYWRKIVRNKMHRMKEQRRVKAAQKWLAAKREDGADVRAISSFGPYTTTIGSVYASNDLAKPTISTRALDSGLTVKK